MKVRILLISVMVLIWIPSFAKAVDCDLPVKKILANIEKLDMSKDRDSLLVLLECLWSPAELFIMNYDYFIEDSTFAIHERETYDDRLDVVKILVPMLKTKDLVLRNDIVAALAYYKYPETRQLLSHYPFGALKAVFYALLDYKRSYLWAIDQLDRTENLANSREREDRDERMAYLNLLYYLAEPGSLPFLNKFIVSSQNQTEKDRAILARDKILAAHPDIKQ